MDQSWFIDAIEALDSMEDIQITKDLCLSSFEENSSTVKQQHQQLDIRALQCHSPNKKVVKRAFSWYGSEVDVQVKNSGYEEEVLRKDGNELHHMGNKTLRSSLVVKDLAHKICTQVLLKLQERLIFKLMNFSFKLCLVEKISVSAEKSQSSVCFGVQQYHYRGMHHDLRLRSEKLSPKPSPYCSWHSNPKLASQSFSNLES
jgi:hypothetical protein